MIIGLSGYANVGKSKVAQHLRDKHNFTLFSSSDPLKRFARDLLPGFTHDHIWGPSSMRNAQHPTLLNGAGDPLVLREFLDAMGMAVRAACPRALADRALDDALCVNFNVVNESCRFRDELDAIRARGGYLIRRKGGEPNGLRTDAEMASIPDRYFDAVIPRMDTLEQLYGVVDVLVSGWRARTEVA